MEDAAGEPLDRLEQLFVDTGAWYAYLSEHDPAHDAVKEIIEGTGYPLLTSTYVFDETVTLIQARDDHRMAVRAGTTLRDVDTVDMRQVTPEDEARAWDRFQARPEKAYSFTDCTSFVLMERLGIDHVLATDGDFRKAGFTNLLERQA